MNQKDGGPAFPVSTTLAEDSQYGHQDGNFTWQFGGMTLRDYFAAKALAGWLATYGTDANHPACDNANPEWAQNIARASYRVADAMLKARALPGNGDA